MDDVLSIADETDSRVESSGRRGAGKGCERERGRRDDPRAIGMRGGDRAEVILWRAARGEGAQIKCARSAQHRLHIQDGCSICRSTMSRRSSTGRRPRPVSSPAATAAASAVPTHRPRPDTSVGERGARAVAETFAGRAQGARAAFLDGVPDAIWAPGDSPRVAFRFTIVGDLITGIELVADAGRLAALNWAFTT